MGVGIRASAGWRARWAVAVLSVVLAAGACDTTTPPSTGPNATTSAVASTVDVAPGAIMLGAAGETKTLTAVARAADGTAVAGTVAWKSSDPGVATIDASGTVTAVAALGTTTVTASIGGISSPPAYVTIAQAVAGAVLVSDAQIVSGPTAVDPDGEAAADAPYEVILRDVTGADTGTILINTESKPVAGRVVSSTPAEGGQKVRLVVVPPGELFTAVDFRDSVDLATGPFEIPADLAAAYSVAATGNSFTFTPKAATSHPGSTVGGVQLASVVGREAIGAPSSRVDGPVGTRALPPLPPFSECKAELGFGSGLPVPVSLSAPPSFSLTTEGTVNREITSAGTKITVQAEPTFTFETALEVKAAFEAKVECKATLVTRKFRVPGWAGLFFGGDVEFGVGFEIGGKVTLTSAKVGGKAELKPVLAATLTCPTTGACDLGGSATAESELEPVLEAPSLNQAKFEPSVNLFGFVGLEAGNADIDQLQFEAIELKAGVELGASLTLEGLQIDNEDAEEGRSKYELEFKAEVGPGIKLGEFLEYLGIATAEILKLEFTAPLGASPTGSVAADRAAYLPGEGGTVTVTLDAASTVFPSVIGIYNVSRVVVVRRDGLTTEVLGSLDATEGQTTFEVPISATGLIDADELYAFVVTKLLPLDPPKLELGQGSFTCTQGSPATIDSIDDDPDKIYLVFDGASACRLVAEVGDGHFPGDGSDVVLSIDTDPDEAVWDGEPTDDDSDGRNWQGVSGYRQNIASGTHTFRSQRVESGVVYEITVTVSVSVLGSGPNTTMTVSNVKITAVH